VEAANNAGPNGRVRSRPASSGILGALVIGQLAKPDKVRARI
jgi:hypothetical protein